MKYLKKSLLALPVLGMFLFATACGTDDLTLTLDGINLAVDVVLPVVATASGVPAPAQALIVAYANAVTTAVGQTATELASTDSPTLKSSKIGTYFLAAAVPNLAGLGASPAVVTDVTEIGTAVTQFLQQLAQLQVTATATPLAASFVETPKGKKMSRMSKKDYDKITAHVAKNKAALAAAKK